MSKGINEIGKEGRIQTTIGFPGVEDGQSFPYEVLPTGRSGKRPIEKGGEGFSTGLRKGSKETWPPRESTLAYGILYKNVGVLLRDSRAIGKAGFVRAENVGPRRHRDGTAAPAGGFAFAVCGSGFGVRTPILGNVVQATVGVRTAAEGQSDSTGKDGGHAAIEKEDS